MNAARVYSGWDPCFSNCTPMTVTVQPPPLTLNIITPARYSPNHRACIEPHNHCAPFQCWDGRHRYNYRALTNGVAPCLTSTASSPQKCVPRRKSGCVPYHTY